MSDQVMRLILRNGRMGKADEGKGVIDFFTLDSNCFFLIRIIYY